MLLFLCPKASAQFDVHFNQYWNMQGYYNPAWAGQTNKLNVTGVFSMQLMGFTNAPKTIYFGADLPFSFLNRKHGGGIGFLKESIGLFRNQQVWGQYAYKKRIGKGLLGIGVQAGMASVSFDPENINLGEETEDEAFPKTQESGSGFDLGLGLHYSASNYYLGLSAQHLTSPRIELGENSRIKISPMVYFTGGYNIQTRNPLISIQPSVHLQSDFVLTRLDFTGRVSYTYNEKIFSGAVSYSPDTSVSLFLGATIRGIKVGYVYEMFTSKVGASNGSHDLLVSYATDINWFKKNKNKHKSIRIL